MKHNIQEWTTCLKKTSQPWKPFSQSLYIDLLSNNDAKPTPIHLGFQTGALVFVIIISITLAIYPILKMDVSTILSNEK